MTKLLLISSAIFMMSSCSQSSEDENILQGSKEVSVSIHGDFMFDDFPQTRATISSSINDVWFFDYMDTKLVQTIHRINGDSDFESPIMTLQYGSHTLYVLASGGLSPYRGEQFNVMMWKEPGDTFWNKFSADVSPTSESFLNITLDRVVTMLKVSCNPEVLEGIKEITVSPAKWYYGFDYINGTAAGFSDTGSRSFNPVASIDFYGFGKSEEFKTDVSFQAKNATDNVIWTNTVREVPFKTNRVTVLGGDIVPGEREVPAGIQLNSYWDDEMYVSF